MCVWIPVRAAHGVLLATNEQVIGGAGTQKHKTSKIKMIMPSRDVPSQRFSTMTTRKRKSKYAFVLKNIDVIKINAKFGIDVNVPLQSLEQPPKTTDLNSLCRPNHLPTVEPKRLSFLDESRRMRTTTLTQPHMKDDLWCWWCKHSFEGSSWGCPLQLAAHVSHHTYVSAISKTRYTLAEKTTSDPQERCSYITDGSFCSMNCCYAWAQDNDSKPEYSTTKYLLTKMYNQACVPKQCVEFVCDKDGPRQSSDHVLPPAAPHWRLLRRFGGYLTIEQFRKDFGKITYVPMGEMVPSVNYVSISNCFEEKLKF
jgi:hypothetical protein